MRRVYNKRQKPRKPSYRDTVNGWLKHRRIKKQKKLQAKALKEVTMSNKKRRKVEQGMAIEVREIIEKQEKEEEMAKIVEVSKKKKKKFTKRKMQKMEIE